MPQLGWHVNIDNCIACRGCEGACKQEFLLAPGMRRRRVVIQEGVAASGRPYRQHVSSACMHCGTPACVVACPVGRLWKDTAENTGLRDAFGMIENPPTGLVLVKPPRASHPLGVDCIGCKRCAGACPFGGVRHDAATGFADKCTGCYHRLFNANLAPARRRPACVVTCTAMALTFGELSALDGSLTTWNGAPPPGAREIADPAATAPSVRFRPLTLR